MIRIFNTGFVGSPPGYFFITAVWPFGEMELLTNMWLGLN